MGFSSSMSGRPALLTRFFRDPTAVVGGVLLLDAGGARRLRTAHRAAKSV